MFRSLTSLLSRAPAQITIWLLLVIVSFGPQHSLRVCTMGCCTAAAAPATRAESCPCCQHGHAKDTGERGGSRNRAACRDCCIDLAVLTKVGPLPKPVDLADVQVPCLAMAPAAVEDQGERPVHSAPLHCTGPPRADARTALIATTNLRR